MTDVYELLERALDYYLEDRVRKAERVLDRIEALDPGNGEAKYLRGIIAFGQGEFEAALDFLDDAVAADSSVARFHGARAILLGIAGRMEDARETFWAAIRLKPDNAEYWLGLSAALNRLDETEAAVDAGRCAVALDPESSQAHGGLGTLLLTLGRHDEALESATAAIAADDTDADLFNLLSGIHAAREDYDLAEASARRSLELDPEQVDSMRILADVLRNTGRDGEAAEYERRIEALSAAGG